MFGKLKEKLKSWTQSFTKKAEKTEEKPEEIEEINIEEASQEKPSKKEEKRQKPDKKQKAKTQKEEAEEEYAKTQEEKQAKVAEKVEKIKKDIEPKLDQISEIVIETKKKEITNIEKGLPELLPIPKEEVIERHEETKEEIKIEEKQSKGFFGKLKEKFTGKESKEDDYDKLKKEAEKIDKEIHFEPSLDKQLRGESLGEGLKETPRIPEELEKESFFSKIKSTVTKTKISDKDFDNYAEDLKMLLLENNVAYEVAETIIFKLKQKIIGREILKKELEKEIMDSLRDTIESILLDPFNIIDKIREKQDKPFIILFCGINGTGKTTTIAKIANMLKEKNLSCILAAGDTFRAASIEQIKQHGDSLGIKVISHEYGSDPASVGFDAVSYAKKNATDCVLIDTAGRMHTEKNLLKEIEKISRVCKPDLKIFVGEAITGNDSIEQIRAFDSSIGIDAIILSKADTDEKGGTSLSVGHVTKKPILYLGTGQKYTDLELFDKRKFTEKLGL
ncbi:signal recognition particle-docking protein FtsY [Candidatus Pacearchaeota archaeon]|nr:signal recognition particle-docking protein FtsY [Candidatus Pacearchaeota archaeon]